MAFQEAIKFIFICYVLTLLFSLSSTFRSLSNKSFKYRSALFNLKLAKKSNEIIKTEFSRLLNVAQVPQMRPVLCRLLAKPEERLGLSKRFDIPELTYFASNVTVRWQDSASLLVTGRFEARLKSGELLDEEVYSNDFESLILNAAGSSVSIDEATDYDEAVDANGDIDLGEISSQYLALELF